MNELPQLLDAKDLASELGVTRSSETVEEKAARYLAEGRVKVRVIAGDRIEAEVRGSATYTTTRKGRRWACDCPAWQRRCSHVVAVELVT